MLKQHKTSRDLHIYIFDMEHSLRLQAIHNSEHALWMYLSINVEQYVARTVSTLGGMLNRKFNEIL